MVLIIRNNRIQSRGNSRLRRLLSYVIPANRENCLAKSHKRESCEKTHRPPPEAMSIVAVLGSLFLYSVAMFTLPFAAFFGVRNYMRTEFETDRFTNDCVSVVAAVVTVNLIIASYAYKAWNEPDEPNETGHGAQGISDESSHVKSD